MADVSTTALVVHLDSVILTLQQRDDLEREVFGSDSELSDIDGPSSILYSTPSYRYLHVLV